jgi:Fe-S-cluster containining protein
VITSCDDCGACCWHATSPPFRRVFDENGEAYWERLKRERPDLLAEMIADTRARREQGLPLHGTPCLWFDQESRRCRHYDLRPQSCREFAVGGTDCLDARRRAGIVHPIDRRD